MKKLIFYIVIAYYGVFCTYGAIAQEKIFQGSYAECQQQAKKENKLILIDLYFVGCMPCAEMDKQVFPDPVVTKELNDNYILYKTDVMKEEDGKKLARKYGAPGFPTYVIVSPEGKTIMTESGFFGVDRFVPLLKDAVHRNKSGQYLAFNNSLENNYPAAYSERFIKTGEKHDFSELESYLGQQKDLFNETAFLANSVTSFTKYNNWAYANLPELIKRYGGNLLRNKISAIAKAKSKQYGAGQQLDSLKTMLSYIRPTFNDKLWAVFLPGFVSGYYTGSQNAASYFALIDEYKLYPTWDERSNAFGPVIMDQSKIPKS
ncbi:thioredoxin family protein [Sphingobacterium sp. E70]|uniref:thioredoxin family protein n=1 Tax=Sphingobacterium sp. E70 TaxID=2853439 RepID=UPI00211BA797|nr:thioredoxin family protein [Sphingobacterium sp. E70]ULT28049.1 thioredoxin family protein [Sphingobacterium sp. E70]